MASFTDYLNSQIAGAQQPSLLDRIYTGLLGAPNTYGGLLTPEAVKDARRRAITATGAQLLAAGGPQPYPVSLGQALAGAVQVGQGVQDQAAQNALQSQLLQAQLRQKQRTPLTEVSPGASLYDPEAQKAVFTAPTAPGANAGPAAIAEWNFYNTLKPEDQRRFLELKRSQNPYVLGEAGGGVIKLNKQTGELAPVTNAAQEAAGQAQIAGAKVGAQTTAEQVSKSSFDLPRLEQNVNQALGDIDKLKNDPALPYITGIASKAPVIPGTGQARAFALAQQIQGQTFLQAYQQLRGSGQISDVEGKKAEAAVGRLNRAQSTEDFKAALDDLKGVLSIGLERARKQSGASTEGVQPTSRKRYNPDTGKIESY